LKEGWRKNIAKYTAQNNGTFFFNDLFQIYDLFRFWIFLNLWF